VDIIEKTEIYFSLCGGKNALEAIDNAKESGVYEKVEAMAEAGFTYDQVMGAFNAVKEKDSRGRKPKVVKNNLHNVFKDKVFYGEDCEHEWIDDFITGIARSFVNSDDQKRTDLSPSKLIKVMTLEEITVDAVKKRILVGDRQARRYIKAAELALKMKQ
jgi:hypothetical protein